MKRTILAFLSLAAIAWGQCKFAETTNHFFQVTTLKLNGHTLSLKWYVQRGNSCHAVELSLDETPVYYEECTRRQTWQAKGWDRSRVRECVHGIVDVTTLSGSSLEELNPCFPPADALKEPKPSLRVPKL